MPTYKLQNKETNEIWEEFMSISQMEEITKDPNIVQIYEPFAIAGSVGDVDTKTDSGWKDNLQRIASAHPNSNLADRYGSGRSIKEVKTERVIKEHIKRQGK